MTGEMASEELCYKGLLVAAFDFGTTFSGYAFSFKHESMEIKYNPNWVAGSGKLLSLKTPTCVLLKPNKEFHSFGFEAENKYSDLKEDDEHHGWYLFRRFKMKLYETKDLHLDTMIEDISGKKMPALTIFGHSIRYLNEHLIKTLNSQTAGIQPEDIQYVITVPAIWDQKAKQFMRKAAEQGGIKNKQLRIALEPEAASIWCQVATDNSLSGLADPGSKYMVIDLGGGTADITVHEKLANGRLKEVHKASGGSWGGVEVDKAYMQMLTNVCGEDAIKRFTIENVGDYFDLLRDFETKKRTITTDTDGKISFRIPSSLKDFAESEGMNMKEMVNKSPYYGKMSWSGDKIRIEKTLAKSLFDEVINKLTDHVKDLLAKSLVNDINAVLLVGGFGECELVREAFKKLIPCRLIVPANAGLAVLKGAVRFGHLPDIVSCRVAQLTYGISAAELFDEQRHDSKKVKIYDGKRCCTDIFNKLVSIGEDLPAKKEVCKECHAVAIEQKTTSIKIYSSTEENPMYVTDNCCSLLGTIKVDLPDADRIEEKDIKTYLIFGDTELKVRVYIPKLDKKFVSAINCL